MSLTDLQIKKLRAPAKGQKTYFDDALKGFGIRVSQGGTKTFVAVCGNSRKRHSLGRYPELTLAEARVLAKRVQADFALDESDEHRDRAALDFREARDRFIRDCMARTKPRTVKEYQRLLYRHFDFEKDISNLTRTDVVDAVEAIRHAPSEQKHAFVAIRTMLNWCWKRGYVDVSPVPPLTFKSETRNRVLSDDELVAIWHRAAAYGYPYGRIVQLLILTGQRRGEITGLRHSWIEDNEIVFPAGFVKNKREHIIPLGDIACTIVEDLPEGVDLLFPSRLSDDRPFNGFSKAKRAFDKPINVSDYTLHDLRRTYSSTMARLGIPIHVTEKLLNHVSGTISGVAAVYNRHLYRDEMREAVQAYEAHLANLIEA